MGSRTIEALCNDKPQYRGKYGLSQTMMKRITHGARCAIKMHSTRSDIVALRHDERQPHGLVEIKCPARAEKIPLLDLCTEKQYKSTFFCSTAMESTS